MRLTSWDYTRSGAYFITLGCARRRDIFGSWSKGRLELNSLGHIAAEEWLRTVEIRDEIGLDVYVIMPNHVHGLVWIWNDNDDDCTSSEVKGFGPSSRSLGSFIAGYKAVVTSRIRSRLGNFSFNVWQQNYYDQIIRNQKHLYRVRRYILNNPLKWLEDSYYSQD
jgi:REP element-mobilizing transposase RayT